MDGEKNLKPKLAIRQVQERFNSVQNEEDLSFEVLCGEPNRDLYHFRGLLKTSGKEERAFDLELKQFLHSGTVVKNSGSITAMVLYCGHDAKIILNQGTYKFK